MKKYNKTILIVVLLLTGTVGCKKLDVPNVNDPDFQKVYGRGDDVESLASGLFNIWYNGNHSYSSVYMMLATAADNITCSWGNQAMRDMSWEPRNYGWVNTPGYSYRGTIKYFFDKMYAVINTASNVIKAVDDGLQIGDNGADNNKVKAFCKFAQGISYGGLALIFDKAYIVDENIELTGDYNESSPYTDVAAAAIGYLDEAISLSSNTFTIPASWMGTTADFSSADFAKLCNSYAARIMANMPRNKTENAAVDWAKVKAYADAGITSDFTIQMDGYVKWYNEAADYLTFPGWGKTDMYVVHLMDTTEPAHWDDDPNFPTPPESTTPEDQRIFSDFEYSSSNWFRPERGYYHYSNYRSSRYDDAFALGDGPSPEFMLSENDMYRAEARAYMNDLPGAAAIINAGTRVTRGSMTPVPEDQAAIIEAIHHERFVEMMVTGMGLQFFDMRKLDLLQKGTPLHFPIPAQTLETFGLTQPFYSFGKVANADGVNTSNGGWR